MTRSTFRNLQSTTVTRLALTGGSEAGIATISRHSLKDAGVIPGACYLHRDSRLADSVIRKLEKRASIPQPGSQPPMRVGGVAI